jgi:Pentapeptide repeats (8 copies)
MVPCNHQSANDAGAQRNTVRRRRVARLGPRLQGGRTEQRVSDAGGRIGNPGEAFFGRSVHHGRSPAPVPHPVRVGYDCYPPLFHLLVGSGRRRSPQRIALCSARGIMGVTVSRHAGGTHGQRGAAPHPETRARGLEVWCQQRGPGAYFIDLSMANLSGADLSIANLHEANLGGASL